MTTTTTTAQLEEMVATASKLSALGLSPGTSGNISVRVGNTVYLSPTGSNLGDLTAYDAAVLDLDGRWLSGGKPSKEFPLHRAFYRRSPEFTSVVHLHSSHAAAASCISPWSPHSALPPLTPYFIMRVGQTPLIPYTPPGDPQQAEWIERLSLPFRAALLQNHGLVVAGTSPGRAAEAAIELEEACKLLLLLGERVPEHLSSDDARHLAEKYGSYWTTGGVSAR